MQEYKCSFELQEGIAVTASVRFDMRSALKAAGSNNICTKYRTERLGLRSRSNKVAAIIYRVRTNTEIRILEALALQEHLRNWMEGQLSSETDASLTSCSSAPTEGHGKPLTCNDVLNVNRSDSDKMLNVQFVSTLGLGRPMLLVT